MWIFLRLEKNFTFKKNFNNIFNWFTGGLLEDRPGVRTRGGRGLEDLGLEIFTLTDVEEDEEYINPGKLFQGTGTVYTYTNSTVMHPDDVVSLTGSVVSSRVASQSNSGINTPRALSRRNSTSTFSTTVGLAKMLNERGIKAVTPLSTSPPNVDKNYTPTTTPCNSPDGSPRHSRSASPEPSTSSISFGLFASGAELIRRTFTGEASPQPQQTPPSRKSRRENYRQSSGKKSHAVDGETRVVERLERMGFDNIMASGSGMTQVALQGSLFHRRESPMAQLTFLKGSLSSEKLGSDAGSSGSSHYAASTISDDSRYGASFATNRDERSKSENSEQYTLARRSSARMRRSNGARCTRPDLGQVRPMQSSNAAGTSSGSSVPVTQESIAQTALGTISSLLFGRKGGLL